MSYQQLQWHGVPEVEAMLINAAEEFFEFEDCAECGGDTEDHTAIPLDSLGDMFSGNIFFRCNR